MSVEKIFTIEDALSEEPAPAISIEAQRRKRKIEEWYSPDYLMRRAARDAGDATAEVDTRPADPLPWLDMSNWDGKPVPEREWMILNRAPLKQAGLFSGEGGSGKTILELMRAVAHVRGKDWLGSMPKMGPAWYIGAEDEEDEIHRRLAAIRDHYQVTFKSLVEGGLRVLPLLGKSATLCAPGRGGKLEATPLYHRLMEEARLLKPVSISIDPLSKLFAGSEIDRVQVYSFADFMQGLALACGGSVTVVSHPSLVGISTGTGISGSTGWHGAFRFRWYLKGLKADGGEQPDNDIRQIEFKKNQYGPLSESITLRYQRGLFLPERGVTDFEKAAFNAKVDDVLLTLLGKMIAQGTDPSAAMQSHNYAPTLAVKAPEAKGIRKNDFADALQRLFDARKIYVHTLKPGTTKEKKIIRLGAA
jgi:RecA-family ATPase